MSSERPDLMELAKTIDEATSQKKYTCPHCEKDLYFTNVANLPESQIFHMRLESQSGAFAARTIGEVILNLDKLMKMIAKDIGGKVEVFVESVERTEKAIDMGFLITAVRPQKSDVAQQKERRAKTR